MVPEDTANQKKKDRLLSRNYYHDVPHVISPTAYHMINNNNNALSSYMALGGARQGCWDDIIQPFVIT